MAKGSESYCVNHQDRPATTRCKTCSKPVCRDCVVRTNEGMFCSDVCAEQAKRFSDKLQLSEEVSAASKPRRSARRRKRLLKKIGIYAVIFIVIILVLYFVFDISSFGDLVFFVKNKIAYVMEKITG